MVEPKPDLGVLVVHGIGEQSPGATVEQATNALLDVLARFSDGETRIRLVDAESSPAEGPGRATLRIGTGETGLLWLIAEARWADSFSPPRLTQMIGWSLVYAWKVVVRIIRGREFRHRIGVFRDPLYARWFRHQFRKYASREDRISAIVEDFERKWHGYSRSAVRDQLLVYEEAFEERLAANRVYAAAVQLNGLLPAWYIASAAVLISSGVTYALPLLVFPLFALAALPALVLLLILLSFASLLPGVPSPIQALRHGLERSVGDAFVLTRREFGHSAMLSSVRNAVSWMDANCERLVVLAHSQGSVIVEELMSEPQVAGSINRVLVYGSAIGLLRPPSPAWQRAGYWLNLRAYDDPINPLPLRRDVKLDGAPMPDDGPSSDSKDIVIRTWNRVLTDHTTYWDARESFVATVLDQLVQASSARPASEETKTELGRVVANMADTGRTLTHRAIASRVGRLVALLLVILSLAVPEVGGLMADVSSSVVGISAFAVSLLPEGLQEPLVSGTTFVRDAISGVKPWWPLDIWFTTLGESLAVLFGLGIVALVASTLTRRAVWAIGKRLLSRKWFEAVEAMRV